ncbi:hypothetical protein HDR70_06595 [bacterium]|nr:hypothetical protein [bacterium]
MTEINYHIGVNEFNSSENEIQERRSLQIASTPKALPLMIDGMIREDSPLGEHLRKLMKAGGYSITFNIDIDVKPMSKSKQERLRQKHRETSSQKTGVKVEL